MKKFLIIVSLATVFISVFGVIFLSKKETPLAPPTSLEYYYGEGCPHCKNVEDFLATWDKKDLVKIAKFEVWNSADNAKIMQKRATKCKLPTANLSVPFLVTLDEQCIEGDVPIIDYFKALSVPTPTPTPTITK